MTIKFPPVPPELQPNFALYRWLQDLVRMVNGDGSGVLSIDLSTHALSELGTRPHSELTGVLAADPTSSDTTANKHVSNAEMQAAIATAATVSALTATVASLSAQTASLVTQVATLQTNPIVRNGSGAPSSGFGNNGDLYIDTAAVLASTTPRLYTKISGAWRTIY